MIDNRIFTFLELCDVMNYHKTAENLKMTQPAVTQHIKYLENLYGCRLFDYMNKKLSKTKKGFELERYARTIISLNNVALKELMQCEKIKINIGATKTIGDYVLDSHLIELVSNNRYEFNIIVDNTKNLLTKLNHFTVDVVMLEGYVDKEKYNHRKIKDAEIVGICSKNHPFVGREVTIEEILLETVVLREIGSGTRNVFENYLKNKGYSIDSFVHKSIISSNRLIENIVKNNSAISFVYDVIPEKNDELETFCLKEGKILHEFNYVFLNESGAQSILELLGKKSV